MRLTPKNTLLIIAIVIIAGAFFVTQAMTANAPGAIKTDGALITQVIDKIETDDSVELPIRLLEGGDAAHESAHIFDSIETLRGLGNATLDTERLTLTVTFDSSVISADVIRKQLAGAGYAEAAAADATPTEVSEDGTVQRLAIADNGGFNPSLIRATAGIPLELTFAPGTECRTTVVFPELNVRQDIAAGGVVSLPALEPGTYRIQCGGEGDEGSIIVE
jgi:hypothetical protein